MNGVGRLIFTLWLGAAFAQVLALLALFNNLEDARSDAIGQTLQTMVARAAQSASASAAIGFPLAYQANLRDLVDQLSQSALDDVDLYILDGDGNVVFSSDTMAVGSHASPRWLRPAGQKGESWLVANPQETVAGTQVVTGIATEAGSVIAVASRANLAIDVLATMRTAVVAALGFLVLSGALAAVGAALGMRGVHARLDGVADRYRKAAGAVRGGLAPDAGGPSTPCLDAVGAIMATLGEADASGLAADHVAGPEKAPAPRPAGRVSA